jgi:tRNA(Ile)-lysidine synthase TilS/MesJ
MHTNSSYQILKLILHYFKSNKSTFKLILCNHSVIPNTEKKNCIHTKMIENLNIKLKKIYTNKYFKNKICSINRDLRKYSAYS